MQSRRNAPRGEFLKLVHKSMLKASEFGENLIRFSADRVVPVGSECERGPASVQAHHGASADHVPKLCACVREKTHGGLLQHLGTERQRLYKTSGNMESVAMRMPPPISEMAGQDREQSQCILGTRAADSVQRMLR